MQEVRKNGFFLILMTLVLMTMGTQCTPGSISNSDDDVLVPVTWEHKFHGLDVTFDGEKTLKCTGEYLKWEDVEVYLPTITLKDGPAEGPLTLIFDIQGQKTIGSDWLGLLEANWVPGDESASSFRYLTQAPNTVTTVPDGAETLTNGFWLGCTKKCIVRGNAGMTGSSTSKIFLQIHSGSAEIQNVFSLEVKCK